MFRSTCLFCWSAPVFYTVTATVAIDANHTVGDDHVDCGHRWTVTVETREFFDLSKGRLLPAYDLQSNLFELLLPLRHRSLNEMIPAVTPLPEGLATWVAEQLALRFPDLTTVTVEASYGTHVTLHRELRRSGGLV